MKIFNETAKTASPIHFVGIGGIGMSGLAEVLHTAGFPVQGSDIAENSNVKRLQKLGVKVAIGHSASNLGKAVRVAVSTAISKDNSELLKAKQAGLNIVHRADVLAEIMQNFRTVAVAGTHGKTSTTALIWAALQAAGADVGIINGGILQSLNTNAVLPKTKNGWLIVEADESDNSFAKLKCDVPVVTNIEQEHMETYGTSAELFKAFQKFIENSSSELPTIICADDAKLEVLATQAKRDFITYGLDEFADVKAKEYFVCKQGMAFDADIRGGVLPDCIVAMPGTHYVQNALAALAVVQLLGYDASKAAEGLANFKGVARRYSNVGTFQGATVIDDYAHHPTEISTTLQAAKQRCGGKVIAVVQPHKFTRLRDLMEEFAACLKGADGVILMPVYTAGEAEIEGVNSEELAKKMESQLEVLPPVIAGEDLPEALANEVGEGDLILMMGAGDITKFAHQLAGKK